MGRRTIDPASSVLGEGLAGRDVLVQSRTNGSCGGQGAVHADMVARSTVFPPTHWCFWVKSALSQEAVQLGWVVFWRMHGSRPSPLPSPYGSCSDETGL